jgi:hypothetical protein
MLLRAALLLAAPLDKQLAMSAKKPLIERIDPGAVAVEVEGELHAELLPTDELLLEAKKPGVSRVFLFSKFLVRVYEVAVDTALPAVAAGGCAPVIDSKSYEACRARVGPGEKVVFELEGLQAMAKAAQAELEKAQLGHIAIGFSPYGLRLKGARDEAERRRALRAAWPALLGPVRLDGP